ncbi:hypothetical protein DNHGIG_27950 [Collibacillus ludicampi]|uniref:SH3b domain-containing protein n=1 Tax=Collibacillus ludicampi TaxID=2771369 RepID=A0AAV4LHL9_9BACL|nr:stalk domain-containing protein [Collibacillus ludicampi]GIM47246.1 hypothetical protein DNHGIG_27950 [Collibacillus ludicampi]
MYITSHRFPVRKKRKVPYLLMMGTLFAAITISQISSSSSAYAFNSGVSYVSRITTYPSEPNFYEVVNGNLYHVIGTPDHREASFYVSEAPSFLKPGAVYVRDANHLFYERDPDGDHPLGSYTPPYEALDLRLPSSIRAEDIDRFIQQNYPSSPLIGLGQTFVDAQTKYGVNAHYLASHAILESGWGFSSIAKDKHNLFGYMAFDDDPYGHAASFPSYKDAIFFQAYFVATQYLNANGVWYGGSPTLDGMNVHYASDPYWAEKISGIMERIHPYNENEYINKSPLQVSSPRPQGPVSSTVDTTLKTTFPPGTWGVTTDDVNFRTLPTTSANLYGTLPGGTKVTVVGLGSNNWYKVTVNNRTGWIYGDYLKIKSDDGNEGSSSSHNGNELTDGQERPRSDNGQQRTPFPPNTKGITTDVVNFRAQPSTNANTFGVLQPGTQLLLLSKGADNWYQVKVNDRTGWVYGDFVQTMDHSDHGNDIPSNGASPSEEQSSSITVFVNGKKQSYDPAPIVVNGRTLVPMRAIFETLGAKVEWDEKTRTAIATKGNISIRLQLDSNVASINGLTIHLEANPQVKNGRMMVPARFVSEALGAQVTWDDRNRAVKITL